MKKYTLTKIVFLQALVLSLNSYAMDSVSNGMGATDTEIVGVDTENVPLPQTDSEQIIQSVVAVESANQVRQQVALMGLVSERCCRFSQRVRERLAQYDDLSGDLALCGTCTLCFGSLTFIVVALYVLGWECGERCGP